MQKFKKIKQNGAATIILALIVLIFMALTVGGATKLIIEEKKRTKSTEISARAYQKADEAAECALWARKMLIKNGNDKNYPALPAAKEMIFPKNILETSGGYCSGYGNGEIRMYHETPYVSGTDQTDWKTPNWDCASANWIRGFVTEGSFIGDNIIEGKSTTKTRSVGATVDIVFSQETKPFVICNRMADGGIIRSKYRIAPYSCSTSYLTDDPGPSQTSRGWLTLWPECLGNCTEACAYYNTSKTEALAPEDIWGDPAVSIGKTGANWCYKYPQWYSYQLSSLCQCLTDNAADAYFWKHKQVEEVEFCGACKRLTQDIREGLIQAGRAVSDTCGGSSSGDGTGALCMQAPIGDPELSPNIWGTGGLPSNASCRGVLNDNNCWACYCSAFYQEHTDMCNSPVCSAGGGNYNCANWSPGP
ncbi:MAG: hypothetical protein ABIC19_02945 [Patescibacteria group bacterium]|nr:hypothetical protein [Patescibacteria group bacterium]